MNPKLSLGAFVFALSLLNGVPSNAQERVNHRSYPLGYFDNVNIGDDVEGRIGLKWLHDGSSWIIVDCYTIIYSNQAAKYAALCNARPDTQHPRDPANGYPVWEVGTTYYRAYPSDQFQVLGIVLSPFSGKRVITLQKTSEPFNFVTFQEDKQQEPYIRVK